MKALILKVIFIFAITYGTTSGSSIGKSVKHAIKKVAGVNISAVQPEIQVPVEVKSAAEFKDQAKDGDPSGEKRNLHTLEEGRGKKKKKIKGLLFLMMVALALKCIMVLKALTIKALLASKIALVLSLLSIMKKLFEKPDQKPQTNIVLKREPEHDYSRNDFVGRIDDGDYWISDPNDRLARVTATSTRRPLRRGVFDKWSGRYYQSPRGVFVDGAEEIGRRNKHKGKNVRSCDFDKGYLLGSLERGRGDLDKQASEIEKVIENNDLSKTKKHIHTKNPNVSKYNEGDKYPYSKIVGKNNFYTGGSNSGMREWSYLDNKQEEENNSRETNINKGMINHYDNNVFKGNNWAGITKPNDYATNNGFENGRSTQVFANWDAYKKFFSHLRSTDDDRERPSLISGSQIRNRQHFYNHRLEV